MLLGIPGFQSISTDVVSGNLVSALRASGMRVSEVRLSAPSALKRIRPRFVAEFILRYLMYPACARRTYKRYGDAPVYFITDHASASISRSIPPPAKVIVLVHDLASILPPGELRYRPTWKNRLIHVLGVLFKKPGIMRADHVFTVSAAIKEAIVRRLGYPAEQITVIYNGVDAATFAPRDKGDARTELGLEQAGQYLMTVTSPAARKNMPCLMRAMHQLAADFPGLKLLVVGGLDAEALHLIGELGLGDRIIRYRNISDDQIAALYAAADLYVFPSWYEGFGLPVVEAMACGCPVIVSDDPALVEVAGLAGLSFRESSGEAGRRGPHRAVRPGPARLACAGGEAAGGGIHVDPHRPARGGRPARAIRPAGRRRPRRRVPGGDGPGTDGRIRAIGTAETWERLPPNSCPSSRRPTTRPPASPRPSPASWPRPMPTGSGSSSMTLRATGRTSSSRPPRTPTAASG